MAIFDTFFQRQRKARGEVPDVFVYNSMPEPLRVQIVQIGTDVLGDGRHYNDDYGAGPNVRGAYQTIVEILRKEIGVFKLPHSDPYDKNLGAELWAFILAEEDVELVLSAVELVCRLIENLAAKPGYRRLDNAPEIAREAIEEINQRMKAHGVGYEYDGEIVRIDSELVHAEAVKPALQLLRDNSFSGAEHEFRSAYDHYRKGKNKEALTDALKAIESTIKVICTKRGWSFSPNDTVKKLIEVCFQEGLIPPYWQNHFGGLRAVLEGSVPTARNRTSGHGQGATVQEVPDYLASYVLHMTASTIVFLVQAEKALP